MKAKGQEPLRPSIFQKAIKLLPSEGYTCYALVSAKANYREMELFNVLFKPSGERAEEGPWFGNGWIDDDMNIVDPKTHKVRVKALEHAARIAKIINEGTL